jgi:hypothetical protein
MACSLTRYPKGRRELSFDGGGLPTSYKQACYLEGPKDPGSADLFLIAGE